MGSGACTNGLSHAGSPTPYLQGHAYQAGLSWMIPCAPPLAFCQSPANQMSLLLLQAEGLWDATTALSTGGE